MKSKKIANLEKKYAEAYRDAQSHLSLDKWGPDHINVTGRLQGALDGARLDLLRAYEGNTAKDSLMSAQRAYYVAHPQAGVAPDLHALWPRSTAVK